MTLKRSNSDTSVPDDAVFELRDLENWSRADVSLAVLGFPVKHSISPPMHNAALRAMAKADSRFAQWRYFKFAIPPDDLGKALPLLHAKGFLGVNLTIPHKILALALVDEIDPAARATGAVNTLLRTDTGYRGFNTDGYGLEMALKLAFGCELAGANVILLGAGGAARAAAVLCAQRRCRGLLLGNRTASKLAPLQEELAVLNPDMDIGIFSLESPPSSWPENAVLINATSAGLREEDSAPLDVGHLSPSTRVYDMIYNPAEPVLVRDARAAGLAAENGLLMLIYQGVRALEIWSEAQVPAPVMEAAAMRALGR